MLSIKIFNLKINLNDAKHQDLLKLLQNMELPLINQVCIDYVNNFNEPDIINKFMKESISYGLKKFIFDTRNELNHEE